MNRYLEKHVKKDLKKKMVFLGGPRQVGKTTLAKKILKSRGGKYWNWDNDQHRSKLLEGNISWSGLHVLDEVHKYRRWRGWIKGIYDTKPNNSQILVTGSAKLDFYRFGGDSLQGRYFYHRLHPLSVAELNIETHKDFLSLLILSGFPEPFLGQSETEAKRWRRDYQARLVRDDINSLERIEELTLIERMIQRLPSLVGSPLSINNLREDLQVAFKTAKRWLEILERTYAIFRLSPFGSPKIYAVKKEQKHYHFDWALVPDKGFQFENLVACHLLKWLHHKEDITGESYELRYFRDTNGREVDFCVLHEGVPTHFIECKWSKQPISKDLIYLRRKFPDAMAIQLHAENAPSQNSHSETKQLSARQWLQELI